MITGYLVHVIKSWDGYKDVSLILSAAGFLTGTHFNPHYYVRKLGL
jgi:hypothetical protein